MLGIVFRVIPTVETTTKMKEMKETACRYACTYVPSKSRKTKETAQIKILISEKIEDRLEVVPWLPQRCPVSPSDPRGTSGTWQNAPPDIVSDNLTS